WQALFYGSVPVQSWLHEAPLQDIAARTGGAYVGAQRSNVALGQLFRNIVAKAPRKADISIEADAVENAGQDVRGFIAHRPRYTWFLGGALLLLTLSLIRSVRTERAAANSPPALLRLCLVAIALALVSGGPGALVDQWLKHGSDAFAREDYEQALMWFEK